jgi:gliding-associated putative ABC transporter substrate-binding component GldG
MSGRLIKWTSAGLGVLLFAVLVLVNYLSARFLFQRFDLTRNGEFTVAPATRRILADLDDVVNVKVYFSRDLPEQVATIPTRARDLLAELQAYSRGKLKIESVDPQSSPEVEARVRGMGIPRVPIAVLEKNRQQTVEVYLGMAVLYGDQKEVIPAVLDNANLEYELMSRVVKMTRPRQTVGFLGGFGGHDMFSDYRLVSEELRRQYDVETVDLTGATGVPDKVTTLVVAGPREPLGERARYDIDQFLMRGGRLLALVDTHDVQPQSLALRPIDSGLADQLASYGVRVQPKLVADWGMNEQVQMPSQQRLGGMTLYTITPYPLWPKLVVDNINESNPMVNQLPFLVLPFTAPLEAVKDGDDRFEVIELFHSTQYATAEDKLFSADPRLLQKPAEQDFSRYLLAAAVTGPQRSFFAGKPVPPAPAAGDDADAPRPAATEPAARRDASESSQLVVVGGSDFATDSMLGQRSLAANAIFFLNAVDWLTMGDELTGIRSRVAGEPMLDPSRREPGERFAPWLNIALVPALVILFGIFWRQARRRRRVVLA